MKNIIFLKEKILSITTLRFIFFVCFFIATMYSVIDFFNYFNSLQNENEYSNFIEIIPNYRDKRICIISESDAKYDDSIHNVSLDIYDIQDLIDALIKIKKDLNEFEVEK